MSDVERGAHAAEEVRVYQLDWSEMGEAVGRGSVLAAGTCPHCEQRYLATNCPSGGVRCSCCGDVTFGYVECVRCGTGVDLSLVVAQ